ncbi:CTP synthase [hydrothermal vent metagenome]|uniref:CTP synthase (glutamine hydrolyzing) n=1 Tax=hydrothermal vent metagenome TaxID=652676 RepID=A0A1W1C3K6_9ZZZZ
MKLASSCGVEQNAVIEALDAPSIYKVPLNFLKQDILTPITNYLHMEKLEPKMDEWNKLVKNVVAPSREVTIGFVGKYLDLKESYKSLTEAFVHSGAHLDTKVNLKWVDSEDLEDGKCEEILSDIDGILVAGGFGHRGVEGKIKAIEYARVQKIPYLGICLGMQLSLIEFARNILGKKDACSVEFEPDTKEPVIYLIDEFIDSSGQKQIRTHKSPLGGTMRLGAYECNTKNGSLLQKVYGGDKKIVERHRHRYEANPKYREEFEKNGLIISGESDGLIEAVELKDHPWFLAVQFHPEFTSRLKRPNPAIFGFIQASIEHKNG